MTTTFGFDVCLTRSTSAEPYQSLGDRGFTLCSIVRELPGAHVCRFILFENTKPLSEAVQCQRQYLEYCEVTDMDKAKEYFKSIGGNDDEYKSSVVYFTCGSDLKSVYDRRKDDLDDLGISFLHKNYNWQEDSTSNLPGWNFVHFKKHLVPSINCSFAEYEPSPTSNVSDIAFTRHANTAYKVLGTIWSIEDESDLDRLTSLGGLKLNNGIIDLDDGTKIWTSKSPTIEADYLIKDASVVAVVIACSNLKTCIELAKPDLMTTFQGRPAAVIKQHHQTWDIVLIED